MSCAVWAPGRKYTHCLIISGEIQSNQNFLLQIFNNTYFTIALYRKLNYFWYQSDAHILVEGACSTTNAFYIFSKINGNSPINLILTDLMLYKDFYLFRRKRNV